MKKTKATPAHPPHKTVYIGVRMTPDLRQRIERARIEQGKSTGSIPSVSETIVTMLDRELPT